MAGIDRCDELDLSSTCMTLSEFKAQWMIILQRGRVESQLLLHHDRANSKTATTKLHGGGGDIEVPEGDGKGRTIISTALPFDIQRLRKRRRLGRRNLLSLQNKFNETEENGASGTTLTSNNNNNNQHDTDIYDCYHQVKIPSSHDAIDMVVDDVIHQWRALDERKIAAAVVGLPPSSSLAASHTTTNKSLPKWYEKHVRLPDGFDYASIRDGPPPDDDNTISGDRVVYFLDPTHTLSYHTELWKLFHSIPTRQQIEALTCHPHQLPNMDRWFHDHTDDADDSRRKTSGGGGAILQGTKSCPSTDWDHYGLSRFRLNDRHDLPPNKRVPCPNTKTAALHKDTNNSTNTSTITNNKNNDIDTSIQKYCGLVRLECLRKQLRRTSTPDPNRMVMEFLETHTLYDVHCAIVEWSDDELWLDYANTVPISSISIRNDDDEEKEDDSNNDNNNDDDDAEDSHSKNSGDKVLPRKQEPVLFPPDATNDVNDRSSSGYFFIENTFYTTGPVDYTTPILQWLQTGTIREQQRRMEHLGIGPTLPTVQSMTDMTLANLPTRIGVRYVHVHHGDVECAIFVTDRRWMLREDVQQIHQFPILHDIWSSSYSIPECEICQNRVAVIATSTECHVTNGHVALCEVCCRQLRLPHTSRNHIERYTIWRGQSDLSAGASNEVAW